MRVPGEEPPARAAASMRGLLDERTKKTAKVDSMAGQHHGAQQHADGGPAASRGQGILIASSSADQHVGPPSPIRCGCGAARPASASMDLGAPANNLHVDAPLCRVMVRPPRAALDQVGARSPGAVRRLRQARRAGAFPPGRSLPRVSSRYSSCWAEPPAGTARSAARTRLALLRHAGDRIALGAAASAGAAAWRATRASNFSRHEGFPRR